jgi:hypothetical protein
MPAATHDILIEQGATFKLSLVWKTSLGGPIDLTGYTARMQARAAVTAAAALIDLTTANNGITLGGVTGTIDIKISAAITASLNVPRGVYDLEVVSPAGDVTRIIQGAFTVSKEVTR